MRMKLIFLTDYYDLFRQSLSGNGLDKKKLTTKLSEYGFEVQEYRLESLANGESEPYGKIILYTSSQKPRYKKFIEDTMFHLNKNNIIIPRYEILLCHENKGFQVLYAREIGLPCPRSLYFGSIEDLESKKDAIRFPVVFKLASGFASKHIVLVENYHQLLRIVHKHFDERYSLFKSFIKDILIHNKTVHSALSHCTGQYILQEFIPDLDCDYKVLVFADNYYVLRRNVRVNDFRASGSGIFTFPEPPMEVLDFARFVFTKLDIPMASLDIAWNGKQCYLLEYQGIHFGPYALVNSSFYFKWTGTCWIKINQRSILEDEYARSFAVYIRNHLSQSQ